MKIDTGGFRGGTAWQSLGSYARVTRLCGGLALAVVACRGEAVIGSGKQPPPSSTSGSAGTAFGGGGSEGGPAGGGGDMATGGGGERAGGSGRTGATGGQAGRAAAGSGGAAAGSGGAAGTAASGQGGEGDLPLPDGCTTRDVYEGSDDCVVGLACDTTWTNGYCLRLPSGSWQCSCDAAPADQASEGFEMREQIYEISGLSGVPACAVAGGLCTVDESELELGEESCGTPTHQSGSDDCQTELSCGRDLAVPFAPDVEARLMRTSRANCARGSDGITFACTCGDVGMERSHTVVADDAPSVCQPYFDFCLETPEPPFDGPTVCTPTRSSANATECSLNEVCTSSIRLNDDVSVAGVLSPVSANCSLSSGTYCTCIKGSTGIFSFNVGLDPTSETCETAAGACEPDAVIEAQGAPACLAATTGNAGQDVCDLLQYCDVPATIDGVDVVTRIRPAMTCRRADAAGPWWCACIWNGETATFEHGQIGVGAEGACASAADSCLALLPIVIGPGPDGEYPPDPLPAP